MSLVMKFGGTSVGSADAMRQTAELILTNKQKWGSVVVVASAMGTKPIKVTDLLLTGANDVASGNAETYQKTAQQLRDVHQKTIDELLTDAAEREAVSAEINQFINRYEDLCRAVLVLGELSPRALDIVGGMGEQMSIRILAAYLRQLGHNAPAIDATDLIVTDSNYQNAAPDFAATVPKTKAILDPIIAAGGIPVVTGFIAADANGVTTTLGRGGSDYSAAILGQAINAQEVWIWTDVDGVMSADPRLVPTAKSIPTLTYREISELAYYGARVLHPKTRRPCVENNIPLRIKNTFNPEHDGTVIVDSAETNTGAIKAVTAIKELALITVEGKGMMGVPGMAARLFASVAATDASVLLISQASSEQSICFSIGADSAEKVISNLKAAFADELKQRDIDSIRAQTPVSIVTVVGAGMRGTPGIAGKVFTAVSPVNLIAIAQGSSECSISMVIGGADSAEAVKLIHDLIV